MKNNPLFFDSTKFRGDNVIVEIDLTGPNLNSEENLTVRIIRHDGTETLVQMSSNGERRWRAEARVEYQQRLKLEFRVQSGTEIIDRSDMRTAMASYCIPQKWERELPVVQTVQTVQTELVGLDLPTPLEEKISLGETSQLVDRASEMLIRSSVEQTDNIALFVEGTKSNTEEEASPESKEILVKEDGPPATDLVGLENLEQNKNRFFVMMTEAVTYNRNLPMIVEHKSSKPIIRTFLNENFVPPQNLSEWE